MVFWTCWEVFHNLGCTIYLSCNVSYLFLWILLACPFLQQYIWIEFCYINFPLESEQLANWIWQLHSTSLQKRSIQIYQNKIDTKCIRRRIRQILNKCYLSTSKEFQEKKSEKCILFGYIFLIYLCVCAVLKEFRSHVNKFLDWNTNKSKFMICRKTRELSGC